MPWSSSPRFANGSSTYRRLTSQVLLGDGKLGAKLALAAAQSSSTTPTPISGRAALPIACSSRLGTRARALPDRFVELASFGFATIWLWLVSLSEVSLVTASLVMRSCLEAVHGERGRVLLGFFGIEA